MALIAVAADKGAPGVSTASLALAAVWPRPVLLAEADPAGGDLVYRLPAADGGRLDPRRGLLSLAVAARRGIHPNQVWEHTQKLYGGLDVLTGVANAEQAGGLQLLWGKIGQVLAAIPQLDVVADGGRLGMDGPFYDLLGHASSVVLVTRPDLEGVVRLRDRVAAVAAALAKRGQPGAVMNVLVVAGYKQFRQAMAEVGHTLERGNVPGRVVGGIAYEPKSAEMLRGEWGGKLDKSMLIRTAREVAAQLVAQLPVLPGAADAAGRPAAPVYGQRTGPPQPQQGRPAARPQPQQARSAAPQQQRESASRAARPQPAYDRLVAGTRTPPDRVVAGGRSAAGPPGYGPDARPARATPWPSRQAGPERSSRPEQPDGAAGHQDTGDTQTRPLRLPPEARPGNRPPGPRSGEPERPPAGPGRAVPGSGGGG